MDQIDRVTEIQAWQEASVQSTFNTPLPYACFIAGYGYKEIVSTSPSDCMRQIEETYGVGKPGEELEFAFRVPGSHNRGGREFRGGPIEELKAELAKKV